jgi:hypothetical protein
MDSRSRPRKSKWEMVRDLYAVHTQQNRSTSLPRSRIGFGNRSKMRLPEDIEQ